MDATKTSLKIMKAKKDYFSIPLLEEAVAKLISYMCMMQKPIEFILHLFRE